MATRKLVYILAAVILSVVVVTAVWPIVLSAMEAQHMGQCVQEMKSASEVIEEFASNHGNRFPTAAELEQITVKSSDPIRSTKWGVRLNSRVWGRKVDDVSTDVPILFSVERKSDRLIVGATLADARPAWGSSYLTYSANRRVHVTSLKSLKDMDAPSASASETR